MSLLGYKSLKSCKFTAIIFFEQSMGLFFCVFLQ